MIFSNNMKYRRWRGGTFNGCLLRQQPRRKCSLIISGKKTHTTITICFCRRPQIEYEVLKDNNPEVIRHNAEFISNKDYHTPTNEILTSMLSKTKAGFILNYALCMWKKKLMAERNRKTHHALPADLACKAMEKPDAGTTKGNHLAYTSPG